MVTKIRESITGYVGPMFAKKTLLMLHDVLASEACGRRVIVFKPSNDVRFEQDVVRSRAGGSHPAIPIPIERPDIIYKVIADQSETVDLIGIDEAQFFNPKIAKIVQNVAQNGTAVVFCGLNTDYRGNAFPSMKELMPIARIQTVEAKCMFSENGNSRMCGADAQMTQRLVNNEPDSYKSPTVIIEQPGTNITYQARCLEHWQVKDMPSPRRMIKHL